MLHGVERPHIWHGNTLTGGATYDGLSRDVPNQFDIVMSNPPFGGKEGKEAQSAFTYKTSATQILFLQHVIDHLRRGGRCGMVVDEGVLFRNNENAFVRPSGSCSIPAISGRSCRCPLGPSSTPARA